MAGFLTACVDGSKVLVPLDTNIQCKIREDEAAYLSGGAYLKFRNQMPLNTNISKNYLNVFVHF